MAYVVESVKFGVVLACFLSGSEIMVLLVMLAVERLVDGRWKGAEGLCVCSACFNPDSEERESVKEEDIVRSAREQEASVPQTSEAYGASDTGKQEEQEEEEEEEEVETVDEFTEIVETFQSSDDGGKTWKTYRKTIRITPEGTSEDIVLVEDSPAPDSSFAAEAASRLSSQPDFGSQVSHSSRERSGRENRAQEKRVTFKPSSYDPRQTNMDDIVMEGPERDEVEVKEESEVLPDGTVHSTQRVSHHKVKHVRHAHPTPSGKEDIFEEDVEVPGTSREDVYELFEHPPKLVQEAEDIEQVLDDGTKVKKHVVMNRMVHLVKMHHESFDEAHHKTEEDYEIEEVIPGTESAFIAGMDSDSEDGEKEEGGRMDGGERKGAIGGDSMRGAESKTRSGGDADKAHPKLVSYMYGSDVDGGRFLYGGSHQGETALDVVEDMLAKGQLTLEDTEGDENQYYAGTPGDDDEAYTHRVVMRKEVHQKTTIRADGQEETVIREDSQVHQDSDPPQELRHSMEQIIQHFMQDSPGTPHIRGEDEEDSPEDGTEV